MAADPTQRTTQEFGDRAEALAVFLRAAGPAPRLITLDDSAGCPLYHALAALQWTGETGLFQLSDRLHAVWFAAETGVAVIAADRVTAPRPNDGGAERGEDGAELAAVVADEAHDEAAVEPVEAPIPDPRSLIPVVLTARYRHTLKGADRGKWELEILEQADAPLVTVEKVIRGVQQRLDEASEPELVGVEALRAALAEGVWTPPQR